MIPDKIKEILKKNYIQQVDIVGIVGYLIEYVEILEKELEELKLEVKK